MLNIVNVLNSVNHVYDTRVRKLTVIECLRLQGFPENWFEGVKGYSDSAAYKAIGNSMAVPCMYWIGRRIEMVESLIKDRQKNL